MPGSGRTLVIAGGLSLLAALGLWGWQQVRLATSVKVPGLVIRSDCYSTEPCRPELQFATLEGTTYELRGSAGMNATSFEVGDEWREILYWPGERPRARTPDSFVVWAFLSFLLLAAGVVAVALGWVGHVPLPRPTEARPPWALRLVAAGVGAALLASGWVLVPPRGLGARIALDVVAIVAASAALLLLRHKAAQDSSSAFEKRVEWGALCWTIGLLGAATGLGLLVLPVALHAPLLASAPLAVAFTLPQQMWRWPTLEQAVPEALARRRLRRRIEDAVQAAGAAREMVVRVEAVGEAEIEAVRRIASGDVPLRVSLGALGRTTPRAGTWYLVVGPALEQVPTQGGGGYRTAASTEGLVGSSAVEVLGTDLEWALGGDPARRPVRLLAPPIVLTLALALGGAFALADREPPLSGAPIPRTGLREIFERDRTLLGRVLTSDRPPVVADWICTVDVEPSSSSRNCRIDVDCGGETLYGENGGYAKCLTSAVGALVAEDTSPTDGDPAIRIDTRTRRVVVRSESPKWAVTIEIVGR